MKKRTLTTTVACLILFSLSSSDYSTTLNQTFPISITVTGGNGTPDGEQVNRDYEFTANIPSSCYLTFKVIDQNSTSSHQVIGNKLYLSWKSNYVGTDQNILASCTCPFPYPNNTGLAVKTYTLHN